MPVVIKRVYEEASPDDGYRVLVDRLWPRGVSKERAKLDVWLKEIAPSPELREWFGHKPERFKEFKSRYEKELKDNPTVDELQAIIKEHPKVTLLYGAHDSKDNQAVVLRDFVS